ncbi:putative serine/threonine-protein kinase nek2 [Cucumis melo var. makuwa]|uniref:Putative serine/threonine-protein kinase nek2 n=1 Tax=Cucumis melo var. makuwa TaxID=1194695 RepID=A0A5D3DA41_CUCMM|nr:putative serine/threonine-protein kinase nek2 [Cucumis melo var. makuwa]
MWKKARVDKKGQYDNEDVQEVVNRIDEISKTCADKESSPNDVLTQALGTRESSERVRGVGRFVTPSTYFHTSKRSKRRNEEIDKLSEENEKFHLRVQELENIHISTQFTPTSAHGSCSRPRLEYDIQCKKNLEKEVVKEEVNVDVIILNDLQEDAIEVRNEKEVVCESNIKMSLPLKTILIFGEKCLLQVAVIECGYYVMRYMRDIITNGSIVVTDLIDTRTSYSQLELDEVRMELADFLGGHM